MAPEDVMRLNHQMPNEEFFDHNENYSNGEIEQAASSQMPNFAMYRPFIEDFLNRVGSGEFKPSK